VTGMASDLVTTARRIGHERWLAVRLFETLGRWVATTHDAGAKRMLATHSAHLAWHADLWRDRIPAIPEVTAADVTVAPSAEMATFVDALDAPAGTIERLAGVYRVALPAIAASHAAWRRSVDDTTDGPTGRVLDLVLRDVLDDWRAGEALTRALVTTADDVRRGTAHQARLEEMLVSARGAWPAGATAPGTATRS